MTYAALVIGLRQWARQPSRWDYFGNPSGPPPGWYELEERKNLEREAAALIEALITEPDPAVVMEILKRGR